MSTFGPINIGAVRRKQDAFFRAFEAMVNRETEAGAQEIELRVHQSPGFTPRTGELQRQTTGTVLKTKWGRRVIARNHLPYAAPIDLGARPHLIRPKKANALRFVWKGKLVFTRLVHHPGNRPYRFLWKATYAGWRTTGTGLRAGMTGCARRF